MKVRIKKTGQILNVEYDDDDLYKGWDGRAVWFYADEFDIIGDEEVDNKPLFTLTEEEVEFLNYTLDWLLDERYFDNDEETSQARNLLNRIIAFQDENKSQ